ncbi:MAG: type II CAAX prenyl endopeptidase Rce1 family protein [Acidobacteriota bacterium]
MPETPEGLNRAGRAEEFIRSFLAFLEVVMVALFGSLLVQISFGILDVSSVQILHDTRFLFIFMAWEASITLLLILLFLWVRGESLRKLGWIWKKVDREVLLGVAAVPILFASTFAVGTFFQLFLPDYVSTTNKLLDLVRDYRDLTLFLISSIFVGGLKEEIQRAFVLDRFERYLGAIFLKSFLRAFGRTEFFTEQAGHRVGVIVGLILWSVFFAIGHHVQGVDNAVGAGVLGLLFGLLYIWRRNLVAPIVSHALYNVTTLLAFWTFLGDQC